MIFNADLDGLNELLRTYDQLETTADQLPMDEIARILVASVHENFAQEGRPPWVPRQDNNPWPILHKTGALEDNIFAQIMGDEVRVEAGEPYGKWHDEGTARLPARPFLEAQDEDVDEIVRLIWEALDYAV